MGWNDIKNFNTADLKTRTQKVASDLKQKAAENIDVKSRVQQGVAGALVAATLAVPVGCSMQDDPKPAGRDDGVSSYEPAYKPDPAMPAMAERSRIIDNPAPAQERDKLTALGAQQTKDGIGIGATGDTVKNIQERLRAAGFDPAKAAGATDRPEYAGDGTFDERTAIALASFEKATGQKITGRVTPTSWENLGSTFIYAVPGPDANTNPAQSLGERSKAVLESETLMATLRSADFNPGAVDGLFDSATEKALRNFEAAHGFTVNGQLETQDLVTIKLDSARLNPPPAPPKPPAPPAPPKVISAPSPNFSSRGTSDITHIVLHHTGSNNGAADLAYMRSPRSQVSAHYFISQEGEVFQMVDESKKAWHAGVSQYDGRSNVNDFSIGIELEGDGRTPFSPKQLDALYGMLRPMMARHDIKDSNIVSHSAVAIPRGRKVDPTPFNWDAMREAV